MDNNNVAVTPSGSVDFYYNQDRMRQMLTMAKEFYLAGCFGADVKNPHQVLVKMQFGFEMGMAPMESINSLYIVNGKVTPWGQATTKKLREHGWDIKYDDKNDDAGNPFSCTVTITKGDKTHSYTVSMEDFKHIKSKAIEFAPKEKLRWHALGRLIRFNVPEVLNGAYIKEEAEDFPVDPTVVSVVGEQPLDMDDLLKKIDACTNSDQLDEVIASMHNTTTAFLVDDQMKIKQHVADKRIQFMPKQEFAHGGIVDKEVAQKAQVSDCPPVTNDIPKAPIQEGAAIHMGIDLSTGEIANKSPEDGEVMTHEQIIEQEAKKSLNFYENNYTPEKLSIMIKGLKTKDELDALKKEVTLAYADSLITDAVVTFAVTEINKKLTNLK